MAKPRADTPESLVAWMVARDYGVSEILGRVAQKYPRANLGKASENINKYAEKYNKDLYAYNKPPLTEKQLAQLQASGKTKGFIRCTASVTWTSPNSGNTTDGTWWVDVPNGLSGSQLREYITNQLYSRFNQQYKGTAATLSQVQDFIHSIDISECQ